MRIAAFDLGSNSFHLLVVEAHLDGSFSALAAEKEMLRVGDVVARTGYIGEEMTRRCVEVLRRFKAVAEAQRADEIVALATAAVREARDGGRFVDRVHQETGVEIKVVDGLREAHLIFTAIRSSVLIDPAPALAADLGGGSLEIMVGDRLGLSFAASLRLGVGRLTAEVELSDPPTDAQRGRLFDHVMAELGPVLSEAFEHEPKMLIGSSGTFASLARMAVERRDGELPGALNQLTVPAEAFVDLERQIFRSTVAERARMPGVDLRRAELLPAGITVLRSLLERSGLNELVISEWALREGIVIDAIGGHDRAELSDDPRELRRSSILSLCRRSNWRQSHARQVASLATQIFDELSQLHRLSATDRELLEFGALAHDIGEHISRTDHDRHGAYLLEHGGVRGFSPIEIRILSLLARFHFRGTPRASLASFGALDDEDRERTRWLVAILRLADALDATHASVVQKIAVTELTDHEIVFELSTRGDAELELWTLRRKLELLEKLTGRSIDARIVRSGPTEFDAESDVRSGLS